MEGAVKANEKGNKALTEQLQVVVDKMGENQKINQKKFNQIHRSLEVLKNVLKSNEFGMGALGQSSELGIDFPDGEGGVVEGPQKVNK